MLKDMKLDVLIDCYKEGVKCRENKSITADSILHKVAKEIGYIDKYVGANKLIGVLHIDNFINYVNGELAKRLVDYLEDEYSQIIKL